MSKSKPQSIHILVKDRELFKKLKGKIYAKGKTVTGWFEEVMLKEIEK